MRTLLLLLGKFCLVYHISFRLLTAPIVTMWIHLSNEQVHRCLSWVFLPVLSVWQNRKTKFTKILLVWHKNLTWPRKRGLESTECILWCCNTPTHKKGSAGYDTKLHPVVMLKLRKYWECGVTSLLPLLPGQLKLRGELPIRILSIGQIDLFANYLY